MLKCNSFTNSNERYGPLTTSEGLLKHCAILRVGVAGLMEGIGVAMGDSTST